MKYRLDRSGYDNFCGAIKHPEVPQENKWSLRNLFSEERPAVLRQLTRHRRMGTQRSLRSGEQYCERETAGKKLKTDRFLRANLDLSQTKCGNPDGAGKAATAKLTSGGRHKHGNCSLRKLWCCGCRAATNDAVSRVQTTMKKGKCKVLSYKKLFVFAFLSVLRNGRRHD